MRRTILMIIAVTLMATGGYLFYLQLPNFAGLGLAMSGFLFVMGIMIIIDQQQVKEDKDSADQIK